MNFFGLGGGNNANDDYDLQSQRSFHSAHSGQGDLHQGDNGNFQLPADDSSEMNALLGLPPRHQQQHGHAFPGPQNVNIGQGLGQNYVQGAFAKSGGGMAMPQQAQPQVQGAASKFGGVPHTPRAALADAFYTDMKNRMTAQKMTGKTLFTDGSRGNERRSQIGDDEASKLRMRSLDLGENGDSSNDNKQSEVSKLFKVKRQLPVLKSGNKYEFAEAWAKFKPVMQKCETEREKWTLLEAAADENTQTTLTMVNELFPAEDYKKKIQEFLKEVSGAASGDVAEALYDEIKLGQFEDGSKARQLRKFVRAYKLARARVTKLEIVEGSQDMPTADRNPDSTRLSRRERKHLVDALEGFAQQVKEKVTESKATIRDYLEAVELVADELEEADKKNKGNKDSEKQPKDKEVKALVAEAVNALYVSGKGQNSYQNQQGHKGQKGYNSGFRNYNSKGYGNKGFNSGYRNKGNNGKGQGYSGNKGVSSYGNSYGSGSKGAGKSWNANWSSGKGQAKNNYNGGNKGSSNGDGKFYSRKGNAYFVIGDEYEQGGEQAAEGEVEIDGGQS